MIGPNCPGVLSPGQGERRDHPRRGLREGAIGLVSRSGTLTYQIGYELAQLGLGNSTIVGIGGDPVVGSSFIDILERFEADPQTELVVMVGEIGGNEEEKAAGVHPRPDVEAGARLHRRLHRAARQDDGPRGRDHLRLVRNRAGEEGSARGLRRPRRHDADRGRAARRRRRGARARAAKGPLGETGRVSPPERRDAHEPCSRRASARSPSRGVARPERLLELAGGSSDARGRLSTAFAARRAARRSCRGARTRR